MTVSSVQNNDNHGRISYLTSIALGGLTGHCLKYTLPITRQEVDDNFKLELSKIRTRARNECDTFISETGDKEQGLKLFKKIRKEGKRALIADTKGLRPVGAFVWTGIFIGAAVAFINNFLDMIARNKIQSAIERENY